MELTVASLVFTPRRNFREGTASGRLTIGFERIRWRPISPRHIAGSGSRVLDMQTIKQLQRFYVDEVFRPQPPIPGSQGSETVSLPCETSAFDRGEYTKQIQLVFVEGSSPSTHTRSRFPLHPTPPGCGWSIHLATRSRVNHCEGCARRTSPAVPPAVFYRHE